MGVVKAIGGWLVAAAFLAVSATALSSAMVLAMLTEVGAPLGAGDMARMIIDDLAGFGPLYGALIAVALAIAFLAAAVVTRAVRPLRPVVFAVAGAAAMAVMLTLMEQVFFGVQLVAGARTPPGFLMQAGAGAAAGLVFAALTPAPERR
jgi:hypothetical protein